MRTHISLIVTSCVFLLVIQSFATQAEQTRMLKTPMSAEEMGPLIFRSIQFKSKVKEPVNDIPESVRIGLPIQFAYNSADIQPESMPFLEQVGKMMTMSNYLNEKLVIEGHTDAVGSAGYNLTLSKQRAQAVKSFLMFKFGISPNSLITKGLGKSKPLPGYNPFDAVNRRVEIYEAN